MVHRIAEIKGITPEAQKSLAEDHITTVEQLLEATRTPAQRNAHAKKLDVSTSQLSEWINRADLMQLKGVGTEMANLLEECGVDSIKELRHRKAENLFTKLKETNDKEHITHHAPTMGHVQEWINESSTLSALQ